MKAIKWTKKIMYEEGHALPQLIHMWHMIVRHPALFYSCRSHFVGQMVNSLSRLGLPPKCVFVVVALLLLFWKLVGGKWGSSAFHRRWWTLELWYFFHQVSLLSKRLRA